MAQPGPRPNLLAIRVLAVFAVATSAHASARADVSHVVARGHTLEAIAHRYHVSVKSIVDANKLSDPKHLKVGEQLTIPGVTAKPAAPPAAAAGAKTTAPAAGKPGKVAKPAAPTRPPTFAARAKEPGVIHATRLATSEDFTVRVADRRGHLSPTATKTFERLLRSAGGQTHPIEPRLVSLLGIVSDHFGGRKIEVVSGYRPYKTTQYTQHSNHNVGKAVDFRVVGVPNEVVRDFCKTLRNTGVGYYPNSTFVHMDVRASSATWIDYSRPGEVPRYHAPSPDADEGTSDVGEEAHAPPPAAPAPPAPAPPASDAPAAPASPEVSPAPSP